MDASRSARAFFEVLTGVLAAAIHSACGCGRQAAGLDEIRGPSPDRTDLRGRSWVPGEPNHANELGARGPSRVLPSPDDRPRWSVLGPGERSDRSCHHGENRPRSSWKLFVRRGSGGAVGFAVAQHRPQDAGELVGHPRLAPRADLRGRPGAPRDHDVERSACEQAPDPGPERARAAPAHPDHSPGAVDQLAPQITVAALADAEQALLAAGAALAGNQPRGWLPGPTSVVGPERRARTALMVAVRWPISWPRTRCSIKVACWASLLTAMKRRLGRCTASQHASASAASCLSTVGIRAPVKSRRADSQDRMDPRAG